MLYSTGNTHLLSAILTDASGRSTWQLARDWLGGPLGIDIAQWLRDPQGVYLGGNEMHGYGYGWFISQADDRPVYFGWGFGGQMLYVIPSLELTVVITSDSKIASFEGDYICALHDLLARQLMPAFMTSRPPASDDSALCAAGEDIPGEAIPGEGIRGTAGPAP